MMRSFKFTQSNSSPFAGLDGTVIFGDGTAQYKIMLQSAEGLGVPQVTPQTQKAPFQQGASLIRTLYEPRTITLECSLSIAGTAPSKVAEATTIKRALGRLLSPVGMGFMQDTSLTTSNYSTYLGQLAYASDGVTYDRFIDCVPMVCEMPNKFWNAGFYKLRIVFFCPDPTWYGEENERLMSAISQIPSGSYKVAYSDKLGLVTIPNSNIGSWYASRDGITISPVSGYAITGTPVWDPYREKFIYPDTAGGPPNVSLLYSDDGVTINPCIGYPPFPGIAAIGYVRSCVLAFQSNAAGYVSTYYISTDGINFSTATLPVAMIVNDIDYSEEYGYAVIVGNNAGGNLTYRTTDGTTWTAGSFPAGNSPQHVTWCATISKFIAICTNTFRTSTDGVTFSGNYTDGSLGSYGKPTWSNSLNVLFMGADNGSAQYHCWSEDLVSFTRVNESFVTYGRTCFIEKNGIFVLFPPSGNSYPAVSYDGKTIVKSSASDYLEEISNDGDIPTPFEIDIPVAGGETSKVVAIGDNFLWSGTGAPPSDHNIVFGTDGLKKGLVTLSTEFGAKSITQFGVSKIANFQQGTFFSLYVSGAQTNNIYVRNTGASAGAPTIRWKNRYLSV